MAALDLHEQEQIDALKAWWKDNGNWLLLTIVLAVVAFGAMRGWQSWHAKQNAGAAMLYSEVLQQVDSNDPKRVNDAAAAVVSKYSSTIYAVRAELLAAQVNIEAKDVATATTQLQWVIDHAADQSLQVVARLKLASLQLDQNKYDDALKLLDTPHPDEFSALYSDLKGDVLKAQGKTDDARAAYKLALEKTDAQSTYRSLIQMKLDALGGAK